MRALWLQERDKNTRFFYSRVTHRFHKNKIFELENFEGFTCSDEESISNILIDYYQSLFTSSNSNNLDAVVADIPKVVIDEMNFSLEAEYTRDVVERALKQMELLKALGPDGFPSLFFQNY